MTSYYDITTALKTQLESQQISTVTIGAASEIDVSKQTILPIAHIVIGSATINERTIDFDVEIIYADLIDVSKTTAKEGVPFYGNNNKHDVFNAMLAEANITTQAAIRGELFRQHTQVSNATVDSFIGIYTNPNLAGWMLSFTVSTPNTETCV